MCHKCGPQKSLVGLCLWGLRDERYQNHSSLAPLRDELMMLTKIIVVIVRMRESPSSEHSQSLQRMREKGITAAW